VAATYVPRSPTTSVVYGVVRANLAALVAVVDAETDGSGLPGFVVNEFRKFLRRGILSHGFARVRCGDSAFERSARAPSTSVLTHPRGIALDSGPRQQRLLRTPAGTNVAIRELHEGRDGPHPHGRHRPAASTGA
jgi:hypothetical protein